MRLMLAVSLMAALCQAAPAFAAPDTKAKTKAVAAAMTEIKSTLKDPDSVKFSGVKYFDGIVCGSYNAKNGFGAYAGYKRFVSGGTGESTAVEGSPGFSGAWSNFCK